MKIIYNLQNCQELQYPVALGPKAIEHSITHVPVSAKKYPNGSPPTEKQKQRQES
jgi:hypothetical protein